MLSAFSSIIKQICDLIYSKYSIVDKDTQQVIDNTTFTKSIMSSLVGSKKICNGLLNNGNPCLKTAVSNTDYCTTHLKKYKEKLFFNNLGSSNANLQNETELESLEINSILEVNRQNLRDVFIEDTFYLSDNYFIYDKQSLEKVGVVENKEYILTTDPVLLCDDFSKELEKILNT
jgi:hypothetical protein